MKTYLFRFMTNYEEAGLIITTNKGLEFAKLTALANGAWETNDVEIIDTNKEGFVLSVNLGSTDLM